MPLIATISRLHLSVAAVCPIFGVSVGQLGIVGSVRIDFDPAATSGQRTAAQNVVNAFDWSAAAAATFDAQQEKAAATAGIDAGALQAGNRIERLVVALAQMTLDQFNAHAAKINSILDAVDAATSLADLKSRVAAIADQPTFTTAQMVTAIKTKIAATGE